MEKNVTIETTVRDINIDATATTRNAVANVATDVRDVTVDIDAETREIQVNIDTQQREITAVIEAEERNIDVQVAPTVRQVVIEQSNLEGRKGDRGLSAYELAVENGFQGSESDWLASLKGQDGLGAVPISYIHEQNLPSSEWVVNHNLNFFPAVRLVNSAGDTGFGCVQDIDRNNLKIILDGAMSGRAFCS